MNDTTEDNPIGDIMEILIEQGFGGMDQAMTILLNEAMKIERSYVLQANAYERTPERLGRANGYKPKNIKSRLGNLGLQIPQVRDGVEFYPSALEKGERSERALKLAMAEMYVKGVTTRKVSGVLEKLCGLNFSSSDVSRASELLDKELERWRNRPIGKVAYLMLDARYEKVHGRLCDFVRGIGRHRGAGRRQALRTGHDSFDKRGRGPLARLIVEP